LVHEGAFIEIGPWTEVRIVTQHDAGDFFNLENHDQGVGLVEGALSWPSQSPTRASCVLNGRAANPLRFASSQFLGGLG
jgi:hypothetical protein